MRWGNIYQQVSKLVLSPDILIGQFLPNPTAIAQVENIISNIIFLHSSDLETFNIYNTKDWNFTPQNIFKWVHYVVSKNVKFLSLHYFLDSSNYYTDSDNPRGILPPSLFLCDVNQKQAD